MFFEVFEILPLQLLRRFDFWFYLNVYLYNIVKPLNWVPLQVHDAVQNSKGGCPISLIG